MKIQILSENLANRIAAGEVVERPASVVKELVENSLDAGAKEISVWLEKSGTALVRVSDDGEGIALADLSLAVERHATSKLKDENDLFRISTLGFRGEALPSMASVSRLSIVSRPAGAESGYRVRVEGGKRKEPVAEGCPTGTTVEIKDLFFNTPARRKFLRSTATELSHICDVINRTALAFFDVHFRLYHAGRAVSEYPAVRDPGDRLHQVFGPDVAKSLVPFARSGSPELTGYLSSTPASYSNSRYLMTFVNRRFVRDRILTHAVLQGYDTLLMKGRYPAAVVYVKIPFGEVDVNVHPAKYEVRFRRQSEVHDAVAGAVRQTLRKEATAPRAASEPDSASGWKISERPLPYLSHGSTGKVTVGVSDLAASPVAAEAGGKGFFSSLTVLGQILGCYLICDSHRGLAVIDQHAAHERVAFEKMRRQMESGDVEKQSLLIPQTLDLPPGEALLVESHLGVLARLGFSLEAFGPNSFAVTSIPALLPEGDYREIVRRLIAEIAEVEQSEEMRREVEERLATIACHSVIRANRRMEKDEIRALLNELDQVQFATQCPHGRPVLLEFTEGQLERMFKRV